MAPIDELEASGAVVDEDDEQLGLAGKPTPNGTPTRCS